MKKIQYLIIFSLTLLIACTKEESNSIKLEGKWYNISISSKKLKSPSSCELKDTTIFYTKGLNAMEYEFKNNGKVTITNYTPMKYEAILDYTIEGSNLIIDYGGTKAIIPLKNVSSEGWSFEQDNRVYCPDKLGFKEYVNFKKF
jgi:hypothetical protein